MKLYLFSYGSNMSLREFHKYGIRRARVVDTGYVRDYTFKYRHIANRKLSAKATIEPRPGTRVYGTVTELTLRSHKDLFKLHCKEGYYAGVYDFVPITVISSRTRKPCRCYTYVMTRHGKGRAGRPSRRYLDKLLRAAVRYRLPKPYVTSFLLNQG